MTNPDDGRRNPKQGQGRFLRTASFWALVILIPLAIFQVMDTSRQLERELTYTEFRQQLEAGNKREAFRLASQKLSVQTRFLSRVGLSG